MNQALLNVSHLSQFGYFKQFLKNTFANKLRIHVNEYVMCHNAFVHAVLAVISFLLFTFFVSFLAVRQETFDEA